MDNSIRIFKSSGINETNTLINQINPQILILDLYKKYEHSLDEINFIHSANRIPLKIILTDFPTDEIKFQISLINGNEYFLINSNHLYLLENVLKEFIEKKIKPRIGNN